MFLGLFLNVKYTCRFELEISKHLKTFQNSAYNISFIHHHIGLIHLKLRLTGIIIFLHIDGTCESLLRGLEDKIVREK